MAEPLKACYPALDDPWVDSIDLGNKLPELNTGTVIGITIAITGNVLISLALNLQKLAHKRTEFERRQKTPNDTPPSVDTNDLELDPNGHPGDAPVMEAAVLVRSDYGSTSARTTPHETNMPAKKTLLSRFFRSKQLHPANEIPSERTALLAVDVMTEDQVSNARKPSRTPSEDRDLTFEDGNGNEHDYLKSKIWWAGFALMNIGEMGNFISYAWAPASVVAPLGTFALMANCVFAPVMLGERFRKRDIFGILIAVVGACTVVLASNASDTRLDPDALLAAISQVPFIIYSAVYLAGICILSILSEGKAGRHWVFVDVGLCALFGGFTVLSTKAVSTLLTMEWLEMFTKWITYPTIAVLALTGVGQIRYLNRALMRFDGKVVIPIQFVLFTMSAIVGSAILYGDFKKATFHQLVTFLYGCAATFTGVFIIAWEPNRDPPAEESPSSAENTLHTDVSESEDDGGPPSGPPVRRNRPALILPNGFKENQLLHKQSAVSILALSPARPLLMVQTPPRELPERLRDLERDPQTPPLSGSQRRRAISYMGDDTRPQSARSPSNGRNGTVGRFSLSSAGLPPWNNGNGSVSSSPEDSR